jgi:hypothetical protein
MKHLDDLIVTNSGSNLDVIARASEKVCGQNLSSMGDLPMQQKVKRHGPSSAFVKQSTSASSLMSLVESSSKLISHTARRAFDKMKGHNQSQDHHIESKRNLSHASIVTVPMDRDSVALRVKFASCAIIYERNPGTHSTDNNTFYELQPPSPSTDRYSREQREQQFAIALQLLQNDIVALSIKAGVPISMLWPAEAMCLNLHSMKLYFEQLLEYQK